MKRSKKYILPILLAVAIMAVLTACSSKLLPSDETDTDIYSTRPVPTPTPMPTPFAGQITEIEVNQGLSYTMDAAGKLSAVKDLVSCRSTAVLVHLDGELGHRPDERDYLELYRDGELLNTYAPGELSTEDCLCYILTGEDAEALTAGEYALHAVADDATASRGFTLTDTRSLRVLMLPIRGNLGDITYPLEDWKNSFDLLKACFPIADDGLQTVMAPGVDLSAERYDLRQEAGLWNAWEALRERAGMLGEYDLVVGYVRGAMGENGQYDSFGRDGIYLLNTEQNAVQSTLCRYLAETLGIGDEYRESPVSGEQTLFDICGGRTLENAVCFMNSVGLADKDYWISSDIWNALYEKLTAPATTESGNGLPSGSTHRLRLTGLVNPEGGFRLQGSMTVADDAVSATPLRDSGAYLLLILGGEDCDEVLYRIYFEPDTACSMDAALESGTVPFDITIPVPEGAKEIRILRSADENDEEAEPMYSCTASPTAPVSTFSGIEQRQGGILRVDWNTEDPDEEGEDSSYELYMCYDGVRLLVYWGTLRYAELDMISLPEPEQFTLLLLSSDGSGSTTLESSPVSTGETAETEAVSSVVTPEAPAVNSEPVSE